MCFLAHTALFWCLIVLLCSSPFLPPSLFLPDHVTCPVPCPAMPFVPLVMEFWSAERITGISFVNSIALLETLADRWSIYSIALQISLCVCLHQLNIWMCYSDQLFISLMLKVIDNALTNVICHGLFWQKVIYTLSYAGCSNIFD